MDLSIDQGLSNLLLVGESLGLLWFLEVLECFSLLSILFNSSVFFFFLDGDLSLNLEEFFVGLLVLVSLIGSLLPPEEFLLLFSLELFLDLFLNEFTLEFVLLNPLDEGHLEVFELGLDIF